MKTTIKQIPIDSLIDFGRVVTTTIDCVSILKSVALIIELPDVFPLSNDTNIMTANATTTNNATKSGKLLIEQLDNFRFAIRKYQDNELTCKNLLHKIPYLNIGTSYKNQLEVLVCEMDQIGYCDNILDLLDHIQTESTMTRYNWSKNLPYKLLTRVTMKYMGITESLTGNYVLICNQKRYGNQDCYDRSIGNRLSSGACVEIPKTKLLINLPYYFSTDPHYHLPIRLGTDKVELTIEIGKIEDLLIVTKPLINFNTNTNSNTNANFNSLIPSGLKIASMEMIVEGYLGRLSAPLPRVIAPLVHTMILNATNSIVIDCKGPTIAWLFVANGEIIDAHSELYQDGNIVLSKKHVVPYVRYVSFALSNRSVYHRKRRLILSYGAVPPGSTVEIYMMEYKIIDYYQ